jgi:hypothetical protein
MDAKRSPKCCRQAPQPRSGAPKAQGLIAALWPQHNQPCRRSLPADAPTTNKTSTGADGFVAPQLQSRISTSLTDVTPRGGSPLINEDFPLSFGLPAVSRLQARMTAFKPGHHLPGKSGIRVSTQLSRSQRVSRRAGVGHFDPFPPPRPNGRCRFG